MQPNSGRGGLGYRLIGAMKLLSALCLLAAGVGVFRLLNKDLGEVLEHYASRLHLDPENQLIRSTASQLAGIDRKHLMALGAGTFFYAALEGLEGIGLILKRRWAEYLTILATALLLPLEIYEIAHKFTPLRVAVLLINLAVLAYLIWKLYQDRTTESGLDAAKNPTIAPSTSR